MKWISLGDRGRRQTFTMGYQHLNRSWQNHKRYYVSSGIFLLGFGSYWMNRDAPRHCNIPAERREERQRVFYQYPHSLHRTGITIVRNVLTNHEIQNWKRIVREAAASDASVHIHGRLHYHVSVSSPHHAPLASLGGEVWQNGKKQQQDSSDSSKLAMAARDYFANHGIRNYRLTQLQFLTAVPDSDHQIWHRDNVEPGLTAIVALTDVQYGATEIILQSHQSNIINLLVHTITQRNGARILEAFLKAGDAILYDARLLHRGRGYSAKQYIGDRPVLVIRWDADLTPPPGTGMIRTAWHRYAGLLLGVWGKRFP